MEQDIKVVIIMNLTRKSALLFVAIIWGFSMETSNKLYGNIICSLPQNSSQLAHQDTIKRPLIELARMNRMYLIKKMESNNGIDKAQIAETKQLLSGRGGLIHDDLLTLLRNVIQLGLHDSRTNRFTGYISDRQIYNILIGGICDSNSEIRNTAFKALLENGTRHITREYSNEIKDCINVFTYEDELLLLGILSLSKSEKDSLLTKVSTPQVVKARLGDKFIEMDIINKFKYAENFNLKYQYANKLGYIGSRNAIKALLSELRSDASLETAYEIISIRYYIIKNLGSNFPGNELFTSEINQIASLGDEKYGGSRKIHKYLDRIRSWGLSNYKVSVDLAPDNFYIYKRLEIKIN